MPGIPVSLRSRPVEPEPEAPMAEPVAEVKPPAPKPKRARDEKGRLLADDPATPENEAFAPEA
jgi:hypothetical protein